MSTFEKYGNFDYKKIDIPDRINNFRVWKMNQNMDNENIIGKATKNQNKIKSWAEVLNEDYKNNKNNNINYFLKENNSKKGYEIKNYLSPNVNRIITDVGKLVSEIKNSEENLSKININSLIKTKNQIQKSEKLDEPTSIEKLKEKEYQASLERKNKKSPNYKFISDSYRKQLNKAFLNFHPLKHLGNMHALIEQNPEINKEFMERTKIIDNEIHNITSKNFYRNQYNKLHKMFEKKDKDILDDEEYNNTYYTKKKSENLRNKNASLPKIANRTSMGFHPFHKYYTTETDYRNNTKGNNTKGNNKYNLYQYQYQYNIKNKKKKKSENKRKFPDKEGRKKELELMEDACKNIINSIKHFNGEDNDFYYKYSKLNSEERKKAHNNILRNNLNTERILLKIQNNNILKGIGDDMDNKTKKLTNDIKDYGKKINYIKDEIIKDIEDHELEEHNFII